MTAPFQYKDLAEFMGSWPHSVIQDPSPLQQLQPSSLLPKATLISTRRETSDGYEVGGLSMNVWVDVGGTPTLHLVSFITGQGSGLTTDHFTLDEVILALENDGVKGTCAPPLPANTAQKSDNFLLLQSQTIGQDSYIRLESVSTAEGIFHELGLQPEITVRGGSIKAAQHVDPSRQLAGHNQSAMQHGEPFEASVLNRMAMQLGINAGVSRGVVSQGRFAARKEEGFTGTGAAGVQLNSGSPEEPVYVGAIASPTYEELKRVAVVVDENGNEFMKEMEEVGATDANIEFTYNSDTGEQEVQFVTSTPFLSTDPENNFYVIVTNLAVETALNDVPMKIIRYITSSKVAVDAVDPATGDRPEINETGRSGRRTQIFNVRCDIEGIYSDAGFTTPIEQVQDPVPNASGTVTRIETANRIFVASAAFLSDTQVGDLVQWSGATGTSPYSNNGNYRVSKVVDDKRIELVNEDYTPAFLNPAIGTTLGSVAVTTDGFFASEPYVKFAEANLTNFQNGRGAIPDGEDFRVIYRVRRTLENILDTDTTNGTPDDLGGDARTEFASTSDVQRQLARIIGPSLSRFEDQLYGKELLSLEFLGREHGPHSGRHTTIHPDVISMFPEVSGAKLIMRAATADVNGYANHFLADENGEARWSVNRDGSMKSAEPGSPSSDARQFAVDPFSGFIPGFWHEAGAAAVYLRGYLTAGLTLQNTRATASGTLAQITAGTGANLAHVFFAYDDGGTLVTNQHAFKAGLAKANDSSFSAFILGTESNDAGAQVPNLFVMGLDGGFIFHGGTAPNWDGIIPPTDVGITMRARSVGETEILRLEGAGINDQTLAMSFRPRRDLGIFSFIEIDEDVSGDWYQNFVLTDVAGSESTVLGEGTFRWVNQATAGVGDELARLNSLGLELGLGTRTTIEEALKPRLKMKQAADGVGFTHLMEIEPYDTLDVGGARLYSLHNGQALQWIINGFRQDDVTPSTAINKDGAGTKDVSILEFSSADPAVPKLTFSSFRHDETFPIDEATKRNHFEYFLPNLIPVGPSFDPVFGPTIILRDTQIQFDSNQSGDPVYGGNPASNFSVDNHLLAKLTVKAWAKWDMDAGTPTLLDGMNISSGPTIDATPERLIFRLANPLLAQENGSLVTGFGPRQASDSPASTNFLGSLFGVVIDTPTTDRVHFYWTTQSGATTTQHDWSTVSGTFSFVLLGAQ